MNIYTDKSFKNTSLINATVTQSEYGVHHLVYKDISKDVRPAADFIAAAVQQRRGELGPDTKIVVLMGEVHTMPTHIFLQQAVHSRLLDAGVDFTAAYERPRNWWRLVEPPFDAEICEIFDDVKSAPILDPTGDAAVSLSLYRNPLSYAVLSHHAQEAFDYYNRITVRFYDACVAAHEDAISIDMADQSIGRYRDIYTRSAAGEGPAGNIDPNSDSGLEIRNIAISRNIDSDPSKTILMHTGAAHVVKEGKDSGLLLTSALRMISPDTHVISVVPAYRTGNYRFQDNGDIIVVNGLDHKQFAVKKWDDRAIKTIGGEINYAQEVQKASGNEVTLFLREFFRKKEIFGPAFARHRQEVIDAYHAQASAQAQKPAAPSL